VSNTRKIVGLGERVALARESSGHTLASLAEAVGVNKSSLWRVEQGRQDPAASVLAAVARVTHVSADWLLTGRKGAPHIPTDPLWPAFEAMHPDATPEELATVAAIAAATPANVRDRHVFWASVLALLRGSMRLDQLDETLALNERRPPKRHG